MAVNVKKKDAQKVTIFQPSQELNNHGLLSKITMFFFTSHKSPIGGCRSTPLWQKTP